MTVSFVLRLIPGLPAGDIAGEVEAVADGERSAVKSIDDLMAFLERFLNDRSAGTPTIARTVGLDVPSAATAPVHGHVPPPVVGLL